MSRSRWQFALLPALVGVIGCQHSQLVRLPRQTYVDKCKGAWAGQMVGVCWGEPYQFQSNGRPITGPIHPWQPQLVAGALHQDDCYVDMAFLRAIETYGLDLTPAQAGRAFAEPDYALYHANKYGRENVRKGILPPLSGRPEHNRHADDIDFQIEADVLGIICPHLPRESNRLCDVFGHIMNYGDGVYGGMFIAGMYTAAFAEHADVQTLIQTGLACIPRESEYHKCISDVVRWYRENPGDWLATWHRVEAKWQDDVDCTPGDPYNIDAKLNGAYVAMGLLYGQGDLLRTLEVSIRCGQDADSTAANAGGIVGCLRGYAALGSHVTGGIAAIAGKTFSHTGYTFDAIIPVCQRTAEAIIRRAGGQVTDDAYLIPRQTPQPPKHLEQWTDQKAILLSPATDQRVALWNRRWRVAPVAADAGKGVLPQGYGSTDVLELYPITPERPAAITAELPVPAVEQPRLFLELASDEQRGPFLLKVFVHDRLVREAVVDTKCRWTTKTVIVDPSAQTVAVRVEAHAASGHPTAAYIRRAEIE